MEELLFELYKSLCEEIKSLKNEVEELRNEQQLTNSLLKIILSTEYAEYALPNIVDIDSKKSCGIIYNNFQEVFSFFKKVAERSGNQVYLFEGIKEGDLAACLTNAIEGDYIIIKGDEKSIPIGIQELLIEVLQNNEITIHLGKGEGERKINIAVPNLRYVFFSVLDELIPERLKTLFPIVNTKKNLI